MQRLFVFLGVRGLLDYLNIGNIGSIKKNVPINITLRAS